MKRTRFNIFMAIGCLLMMFSLLLTGCGGTYASTAATTTSASTTSGTDTSSRPRPDDRLTGQWTNGDKIVKVVIGGDGKPVGEIPVGEWYNFDGSGRFVRIARFMTFAIGGIMVEEGDYSTENGVLYLSNRTESFFPDEGSPQHAKYREPLTDDSISFWYRISLEQNMNALYMRSDPGQSEIRFIQ